MTLPSGSIVVSAGGAATGDASSADGAAYRDRIPPLPADTVRPRWSVMIPTYNCSEYLGETLRRVLDQNVPAGDMQVEVVDDHSTLDDPESVVNATAAGRVAFHRQPENVGHVGNFNTCLRRAQGQLVHLLHGDDYVLYGFYARFQAIFEAHPEVGAVFCRHVYIDERGHWMSVGRLLRDRAGVLDGWLEQIAEGQQLQPPAIVVRRSVYERLGGFDRRIRRFGEDWEMYVRIAAHYPVWYEPEPMAAYRIHMRSLSGRSIRTGADVRDLATAIEINRALLPVASADAISAKARRVNALGAIRRGHRALLAGDLRAPLVQVRRAVALCPTPRVWLAGASLVLRCIPAAAMHLTRVRPGR